MILWELGKVFFLSLVGITGILLMAGIIAEASQQGLGPAQILEIIPFLIPSTLPYTIPATTLFATCVVYGRLAHDNEILAIRAAGINLIQVVWPAVFLGVLMSTATMGLYYRIIPYTHRLMRTLFLQDVEEGLYAMLRRDHQINYPKLSYAIFVRRVDGHKLYEAIFKRRREGHEGYDAVAWAREAELRVDLRRKMVIVRMRYCETILSKNDSGILQDQDFEVPLPSSMTTDKPPKPRDMSWQEILSRREDLTAAKESVSAKIALMLLASQQLLTTTPNNAEFQRHLKNLRELQHTEEVEIVNLDTELHMRPALSFGCLFFVLVGCPVGIWFSKSDYLSAFTICFLPIVFLYYPLLLCGSNMAKDGKLLPIVGVWIANGVMGIIAAGLYGRLLRN
jgi:lipopolysaccharide export system permease protein